MGCKGKEKATWSNIPHSHVAPDPEILQKIQTLQQLRELHTKLSDSLEKNPQLRRSLKKLISRSARTNDPSLVPSFFLKKKKGLKQIVFRREKEIVNLEKALQHHQDDCGELFILLIGDKGGGSFKLLLQDLDTVKPNSPFNGVLIGEMNAEDSYDNLKTAFADIRVPFSILLPRVACFQAKIKGKTKGIKKEKREKRERKKEKEN